MFRRIGGGVEFVTLNSKIKITKNNHNNKIKKKKNQKPVLRHFHSQFRCVRGEV